MDKNSKDIDLKIYCTDVSRAFMEKRKKTFDSILLLNVN